MSKIAVLMSSAAILLVTLLAASGCGERDGEKVPSPDSANDSETAAERERRAETLYDRYRTADYEEKIRGLTEVAHVYWDTPSGPPAARELVFYLMDDPGDDPATALRELELLRKRRPESEEMMTAAIIFTHALQKRLLAEGEDPRRELRERLFERGKIIWVEVAEDLCNRPEFVDRFDMHLEWGNGYMLSGEFAKAEEVWARVETFDPLPPPAMRHRLLVKRANLQRERLDGDARSLELFREAVALHPRMKDQLDEGMRAHISEAMSDLERRIGGGK